MSVSISGWVLDSTYSIPDIFSKVKEMRPVLNGYAKTLLIDFMADKIISTLDPLLQKPFDPHFIEQESLYYKAYNELSERRHKSKANSARHPYTDAQATFVAIPLQDGRCLILPFCEHEMWIDFVMKTLGAEPWFWNNSCDRPKSIPSRIWKQRETDWREALSDFDDSPADVGMTFQVVSSQIVDFWNPDPEDIISYISTSPKFDIMARAKRLAKDLDLEAFAIQENLPTNTISTILRWTEAFTEGHRDAFVEKSISAIAPSLPLLTVSDIRSPLTQAYPEILARRTALIESDVFEKESPIQNHINKKRI